jgi:hypothetical protein
MTQQDSENIRFYCASHSLITAVTQNQTIAALKLFEPIYDAQASLPFIVTPSGQEISLKAQKPYLLGAVLDEILHIAALSEHHSLQKRRLGTGWIDTHHHLFYATQDAEPVRLTEKESALLVALSEAGPAGLSRDTLLKKVWAYTQELDTHTLETHIYRLRQKLPDPELLRTTAGGYALF